MFQSSAVKIFSGLSPEGEVWLVADPGVLLQTDRFAKGAPAVLVRDSMPSLQQQKAILDRRVGTDGRITGEV